MYNYEQVVNGKAMKELHTNYSAKKEYALLQTAKEIFEAATGLHIALKDIPHRHGGMFTDAAFEIEMPGGGNKTLFAEIKTVVTQAAIGHMAEQLRRLNNPGILITRYVTPQQAEQLKEHKVPFMDTAGNTFINDPPLFVYITGKKLGKDTGPAKKVRVFRPTGLQLVFALLCNPELANAPYRDIARAAQVALGTVGWAMDDLKRLGYLLDKGRYGRKIINLKKLFTAWVDTYARDLRPKMHIGRFAMTAPGGLESIDWQGLGVYLGGEAAAAKITEYLKPETVTVYLPKDINTFARDFILKYRLKKDAAGNIELMGTFWQFEYPWNFKAVAPPVLVYADLVAAGNDRNIETAKIIYDQYIARHIEEA